MLHSLLKAPAKLMFSLSLAAAVLVFGAAISAIAPRPAAAADLAQAKAIVVAAKAKGLVGEQADGYLGVVGAPVDTPTQSAIQEINAGRAAVYRDTAAKTGASVEAAGEAAARQLIAKVPTGQYYKPLNGEWTKK